MLVDTLGRMRGMSHPTFENADGDEILFHEIRFPLASGIVQNAIAARLETIPNLQRENARFWNCLGEIPKETVKASKVGSLALDVTLEDCSLKSPRKTSMSCWTNNIAKPSINRSECWGMSRHAKL